MALHTAGTVRKTVPHNVRACAELQVLAELHAGLRLRLREHTGARGQPGPGAAGEERRPAVLSEGQPLAYLRQRPDLSDRPAPVQYPAKLA